mmetsp:Transcript_37183/g.92496  ORF Transcript_37183/g.92496 Transcript_37183/m.92496 type:complete len:208 (-) Transcript_37183:790-1413(-)
MMGVLRVLTAFLYGVLLGVVWECASMGVLLAATLVEHLSGTLTMAVLFLGIAAGGFLIAAQAELGRPLLSILAFRLTAQLAMTIGTGTVSRSFSREEPHPPSERLTTLPSAADSAHNDVSRHAGLHIRPAARCRLAPRDAQGSAACDATPLAPPHFRCGAAVRAAVPPRARRSDQPRVVLLGAFFWATVTVGSPWIDHIQAETWVHE